MSTTHGNLEQAFSGESQASRKYKYFAEQAEKEGLQYIAHLFRAASEAETVHARNHFKVIHGIKSSKENLHGAIEGELHEYLSMYPEFIKQANEEGNERARYSFYMANKVEQVHHDLYKAAVHMLEKNQVIVDKPIYVCQVCGNTVENAAPDQCAICGAPKKSFKLIA